MDDSEKLQSIQDILAGIDEQDMTTAEYQISEIAQGRCSKRVPASCQANSGKLNLDSSL